MLGFRLRLWLKQMEFLGKSRKSSFTSSNTFFWMPAPITCNLGSSSKQSFSTEHPSSLSHENGIITRRQITLQSYSTIITMAIWVSEYVCYAYVWCGHFQPNHQTLKPHFHDENNVLKVVLLLYLWKPALYSCAMVWPLDGPDSGQ